MLLRFTFLLTMLVVLVREPLVSAGMPTPIPSNPEKVYRLNESPLQRLQTISFFAAGIVLCAVVVRSIWNFLQRDFPTLPRLTLGRSLGAVFLWGLLFIIALTMISGARELMTPGAWKKQGFVYKLADEAPAAESASPVLRRQGLERLRTALWQFAAIHHGRFPSRADLVESVWEIPDSYGMQFTYVGGLVADGPTSLLAYEPELDAGARLVLLTNGDILTADTIEIKERLKKVQQP